MKLSHIYECENAGCVVIYLYNKLVTVSGRAAPVIIKLECFEEMLLDTTAGLTYHSCALSVILKQNVEDIERLFDLLWIISNACDERA